MTTEGEEHVDLLGLLTGETTDQQRTAAVAHLDSCASCRQGFLDMAISIGLMRDAARHAPVDPSEVPPLRLDLSGEPSRPAQAAPADPPVRRRQSWRPVLVGLALVAALGGGIAIGRSGRPAPAAGVTLTAIGTLPTHAQGEAHMLGSGQRQEMNVTVTGLTAPASADHFEVWLLDTATGRVEAVGAITGSNTTFALPASRAAGFDAIDVSLQTPSDGTKHSGHSVLRGTIA